MVQKADMQGDEEHALSLTTINRGAAVELFQQELEKVLENVLDPNTPAEAKRTITLKVTFVPNESRQSAQIAVEADSKLAPFNGVGGVCFVGRRRGRAMAIAHDPQQMQIRWDDEAKPRALPGTGTGPQ